jgi:hypothetical protein
MSRRVVFRQCARPSWSRWTREAASTIVILVVLWASLSGCGTGQHFFDVTGEMLVPSAQQHYDEAVRMAADWKADAYLASVTADVASSSGVPPTGGHLTYMFDSRTSPTEFYVVRLTQGTWTSEVLGKTAAENSRPIEQNHWPLDSVDAWSIALADGGEEFLMEHQEPRTSIDATLLYRRVGEESLLVWDVDFNILFGPRLLLMIDPKTGEILEVITR